MESDVKLLTRFHEIEDDFQNYNVFISHRGPDTKTGFVGFLYDYLKEAGLLPFLDCKVIDKGQDAWTCIEHAIKTTSIALVVFSENFAQSKWCLDELHLMLNTPGIKVLPIFYKVQPCDVRYPETGPFAVAFDKLKQRHNEIVINQWKEDLKRASKLNGWEHRAEDRSLEIDLVKDIKRKVFELASKELPLDVGEYVFGVNEVAIEIIQKLEDKKKIVLLGLWGMGGIGKSTLAKELYNRLRKRFARVCYVEDVKDKMVQSNGITEVQNNMLNDLGPKDVMKITNKSMGKTILEEVLWKKCILLVLDDISDNDMSLLISRKMLGEGSLCIVTSRNKRVLNAFKDDEVHIHDVQGLSKGHSIQVLASYAFGGLHNIKLEFEDLVKTISQACGGIPLVLKVCGALLTKEVDVDVWRDVLEKLINGMVLDDDAKIFKCLRISFDALQGDHQEMFLDITCALLGKPRNLAVKAWGSHGWRGALGIRTLEEKALVVVDKDGCLRMHDHLRDMGREIVRQRRENDGVVRRLWMPESTTFLNGDVGLLESLETLTVFQRFSSGKNDLDISHMKKLRILICDDSTNFGMSTIPKGLCWWECYGPWFGGPQMKRIYPTILTNNKLVILNLQRSIFSMLPEAFQELKNLEVLNLKRCENLSTLPESFGGLRKLQDLNLELSGIKSLPKTFGRLINLEVLNISKCSKLDVLSDSMGDLKMLRDLNLEGSQIASLPESFGELGKLEILNLSNCKMLHMLPESLGGLQKLHDLNLESSGISSLPESIGGVSNLEVLNLTACRQLLLLPHSIRCLQNITNFSYSRSAFEGLLEVVDDLNLFEMLSIPLKLIKLSCLMEILSAQKQLQLAGLGIEALPEWFGELTNLEMLHLVQCRSLKVLPESFGGLVKLQNLSLNHSALSCLPYSFGDLTNLEELSLAECQYLVLLPESLGGLRKLRNLKLDNSIIDNLSESFGDLNNIEVLSLAGCKNLKLLPKSFGGLRKLRNLKLDNSIIDNLSESFGDLNNIEVLSLAGCKNLKLLPKSFGGLRKLRNLKLDNSNISNLFESFGDLNNIEVLSLAGCKYLKHLPKSFGGLRKLRNLKLDNSNIDNLSESFGDLNNIEVLSLAGCKYLKLLPKSFGNLNSLRDLNLESSGISCLPASFGELSNLEVLNLTACEQLLLLPHSIRFLQNITNFSYSRSAFEGLLKVVEDLNLFEMLDIPSKLIKLSCLMEILNTRKQLQLVDFAIESLPELFGDLNTLEVLDLSDCYNLKLLPHSFGRLRNLQILTLYGTGVKSLPESFGDLINLEVLDLSWCTYLELLPDSFGRLSSLGELDLSGCPSLEALPQSFGDLNNLEVLDLSWCTHLELLPDSFGRLSSLRELDLSRCSSLEALPQSFTQLTNLLELNLHKCPACENSFISLQHLMRADLEVLCTGFNRLQITSSKSQKKGGQCSIL